VTRTNHEPEARPQTSNPGDPQSAIQLVSGVPIGYRSGSITFTDAGQDAGLGREILAATQPRYAKGFVELSLRRLEGAV